MSEDRPTYDAHPASTVVKALNEPFIKFYPAFARAFGGSDEAILLQHLIDWTRLSKDGWVFRTQAEMEADTGIPRKRQWLAVKTLVDHGVLTVELRGAPARNWYRVNVAKVAGVIEQSDIVPSRCSDMEQLDVSNRNIQMFRNGTSQYQEINRKEIKTIDPTLSGSGAPAPKRKPSRISEDWMPSPEIGERSGLAPSAVAAELDKFRDHFLANGKTMLDWDAAWRNWLRRSQTEFAPRSALRKTSGFDRFMQAAQFLKEQGQ